MKFFLIQMKSENACLFVYRCLSFSQNAHMTFNIFLVSFWTPACPYTESRDNLPPSLPALNKLRVFVGALQVVFAGECLFPPTLGGW